MRSLRAMTEAQRHRGPDGEGFHAEPHLGFGHRRLAIVDLAGGAQPMATEDGAVVVETGKPDVFYSKLTEMAASGEFGAIDEVTSPDDNLAAVFQYLVK